MWNKELTHHSETTALTSGYGLEARPEAKADEKQQEKPGAAAGAPALAADEKQQEKPGAAAGPSALAAVLSLLATVFFLTAVMVYMWCNKKRVTQQSSAGKRDSWTSPPGT